MQATFVRAHHRLATAIALSLGISGVDAATITVTDANDPATVGLCTLRQAIASANSDSAGTSSCTSGSGDDTIVFAGSLANQKITLSEGQLDITSSVTINGTGQTFDANQFSRVLAVSSTGALTASHVTITGGKTTTGGSYGYTGGGIQAVGGASVNLSDVTLNDNRGTDGGGALAALTASPSAVPSVTLSRCTVSGNNAAHKGGGIVVDKPVAGGLTPTLTISDSVISGNTVYGTGATDYGGAIYLNNSIVDITRTTISGNSAPQGGAILGLFSGIHTIDSTVSGNSSSGRGAGIFAAASGLIATNTTITANTAGGPGGAIIVVNDPAIIINSTISGNTAPLSPGIEFQGNSLSSAKIYNSIIANTGGDCDTTAGITVIGKHNLLHTAGCGITAGTDGNLVDDPQLGTLANNGGPTLTMAPAAGSTALNTADPLLAIHYLTFASSEPLGFDQRGRGYPRNTVAGAVDIGAYQHQGNDRIFTDGLEAGP